MPGDSSKPVRKRPCPYCGKKLQYPNKLKGRNNLARHLGNACAPYQRETIGMMNKIVFEVLGTMIDGSFLRKFQNPVGQAKDVEELQRMMTLDSRRAPASTAPQHPDQPKY